MAERKCALITGASSGIGKELTYLFARDGYSLILSALNHTKVEGFGMQISEEYKVPVETISADLSQKDGARELFDKVKKLNKTIDVLVNNAGIGMYGDFKDVEMEEYLNIINVNIISFTHLAKLFVPDIIEKKGKILNTASVASFQPGPHMSVYYATKAYDLSLSLALAEELEHYGVTVTALCPGPTVTNFQKRAKQEKTRAFQNKMLTMDPQAVAKEGYEAMKQGKRVVVAGAKNKVTMQLERFMSHKFVTKMAQLYLTETGSDVMSPEKEQELHSRADEATSRLQKGRQSHSGGSAGSNVEKHLEEKRRHEASHNKSDDWTAPKSSSVPISKKGAGDKTESELESKIEEDFQADMQMDELQRDPKSIKDPIQPPEWTHADHKPRNQDKGNKDADSRRKEMESDLESQVDKRIGEGMSHSEPIRQADKSGKQDKPNDKSKGDSKPGGISDEKIKERLKEDRGELS